ncbi:hypothetical protein [Antiquaquibacter soli]|uniref:DUF1877 family protein n=1 Tax=Antiquaquibacter soli TaxID=3064523 RepID=A0ABT9BSP3_9MICO|nr:hypothetical protein [Protaetiibacter sp. WY-16]MDO7883659.1 hypothetical protein [Protaetiibacter sp. WY-16]
MAVTQQLARLTERQIALCGSDVAMLERVCGGEELPADDYAQLDWAPAMLNRAAARSGLAHRFVEALERSTAGSRELHPGYTGLFATYEALTCLSEAETAAIAALLDTIDTRTLLSPPAVEAANEGFGVTDPQGYLLEMFERLRGFYDGAARRGMGMALWWD